VPSTTIIIMESLTFSNQINALQSEIKENTPNIVFIRSYNSFLNRSNYFNQEEEEIEINKRFSQESISHGVHPGLIMAVRELLVC
jgi:hypothetical protein